MFTNHCHNSNNWSTLINEKDLENSVIERIIRNEFHPTPMVYQKAKINWAEWIPRGDSFRSSAHGSTEHGNFNHKPGRASIPGLRPYPPYPQLSTLTMQQHHQCLRVLAAKNPHVLPKDRQRPSKNDYKVFEEVKELYEKEQIEYMQWAKQCWMNGDCVRALRPKPLIETVYEAEFRMRASQIRCLPKEFYFAAQIPLESTDHEFELVHKEDLIKVDILDLPALEYTEDMQTPLSLLNPIPMPEPCAQHPCKFVLPNSGTVSTLSLLEVHSELAQYAVENGAQVVAGGGALRCLLETQRSWQLPVSVVQVGTPDGGVRTVLVLGGEFGVRQEPAPQRAHRACTHLLRHALAPSAGHYKMNRTVVQRPQDSEFAQRPQSLDCGLSASSDDERLNIDEHSMKETSINPKQAEVHLTEDNLSKDLAVSSDEERLQIQEDPAEMSTICYVLNQEETAKSNTSHFLNDLEVSSDDDDRLLIDDRADDDNCKSTMDPNRSENFDNSDRKTLVPTNQPNQAKSLDEEIGEIVDSSHTCVENTNVNEPGPSFDQTNLSNKPDQPNITETNTIRSNHVRKLSFTDNSITSGLGNDTNLIKASDGKTQDSIEKSIKSSASNLICKPISNLETKQNTTLKSCLRKTASADVPEVIRPKRKSSDLNTSYPKNDISISESDGNDDSDSIPLSEFGPKTKTKLIMSKTYGLRSRGRPQEKLAKVDKKKNINIKPNTVKSNIEDTKASRRSSRLSGLKEVDKSIQKDKSNGTPNSNNTKVTLRRSTRLNNTINSENKDVDEKKPRKSPRLAKCAISKTHEEQEQISPSNPKSLNSGASGHPITSPQITDTSTILTRRSSTRLQILNIVKPMSPRKNPRCVSECCVQSKIDGDSESRRKSLAPNNFSDLKNDRTIENQNRKHSVSFNELTRLNEMNNFKAFSNQLSELANRYFQHYSSDSSNDETDNADIELNRSNRTKRYTRRSNSFTKHNNTEMSETDLAESKTNRQKKCKLSPVSTETTCLSQSQIENTKKAAKTVTEQLNSENVPESQGDINEIVKFEIDIDLTELANIKINENPSVTSMIELETGKLKKEIPDTSLPEANLENALQSNKKLQSKLHSLFSDSSEDSCIDDDTEQNKQANEPIPNKLDSTETTELNQSKENSETKDNLEADESRQENTQAKDQVANEHQTVVTDGDNSDQSQRFSSTNENNHKESNEIEAIDRCRRSTNSTDSFDDCNANGVLEELTRDDINEIIGVNNCACKGTLFETPPPRSFKKWHLTDKTSSETIDMIIHMSHKVRQGVNEVLLEPIVEYQPEYGGARQPPGRLRALALELMLRDAARLLHARVDYEKGEVLVLEGADGAQWAARHGAAAAGAVHAAVAPLRHLRPGHYVLDHDPRHGPNAMLYARGGGGGETLTLHREDVQMPAADDANLVKKPYPLEPVLLPYHKFRKILPCAFPPYKNMVKEDKKAAAAAAAKRAKHPPQAIQWKKKKKKVKKVRQT